MSAFPPLSAEVLEWRRQGVFAIAMTARYFDRLRQLTNAFDAAFRANRKVNDYSSWQFLDNYNLAELEWLYTEQQVLYGSGSTRLRLLQNLLSQRGMRRETPKNS